MIEKRKTVIKNRIKKALIPGAIREKKAAQRYVYCTTFYKNSKFFVLIFANSKF